MKRAVAGLLAVVAFSFGAIGCSDSGPDSAPAGPSQREACVNQTVHGGVSPSEAEALCAGFGALDPNFDDPWEGQVYR